MANTTNEKTNEKKNTKKKPLSQNQKIKKENEKKKEEKKQGDSVTQDSTPQTKQNGEFYHKIIEEHATAIADADDLSMIQEVYNDPLILLKYRLSDYVQRPDDIQKCFNVCCLVLKTKIKHPQHEGDVTQSEYDLIRITNDFKAKMTDALKLRRNVIHYAIEKVDDEHCCYVDSEGKTGTPFCSDEALNLEINEFGETTVSISKDSEVKVKVEDLQELDDMTAAVNASTLELDNILKNKNETFVDSVINLVEEKIQQDAAKKQSNPEVKKKYKLVRQAVSNYKIKIKAAKEQTEEMQEQRVMSPD